MAWRRKKSDPISERARDLNTEIASLEAAIKRLDSRLNRGTGQSKASPTVTQQAANTRLPSASVQVEPVAVATKHEPVFEEVRQVNLQTQPDVANTPEHYNELGIRKFDLPAFWRRLKGNFSGPTTSNPKLVSYLAAGGIQGLSPLRREKRVARDRLFVLVSFLFLVLLGILMVYLRTK